MHQVPIIPLLCLAVSSILFGLAYSDAVLYSPGALIACLAFTFATVLAYWIYCQPCSNQEAKEAHKDPSSTARVSLPAKPDVLTKIKDWFSPAAGKGDEPNEANKPNEASKPNFLSKLRFWEHPSGSGDKMEEHSGMEGRIVVFRKTKVIEFLHVYDAELYLSLESRPAQKSRRLVAEKIRVDPEDIVTLKKVQQSEVTSKSVTYWLVELRSNSHLKTDSDWLPLKESLKKAPADYAKVLQDGNDKIEAARAAEEDQMKAAEPLSKDTGVGKAKLQQWYEDPDKDLLWKVLEKRWTKSKVEVSRSGQASKDASPSEDLDERGHPNRRKSAASEETDQPTVLPKTFFNDYHPAKHPSHPHADVDERHPNKVPVKLETQPDQPTALPKTYFDDSHPAKLPPHPNAEVDQRYPNQVPEDQPAEASDDADQDGDCSKEIWITVSVSVLTTVVIFTAFFLIFHFFPDCLTDFKDAVNGYLGNAYEDLKEEKDKAVDNAKDGWNQMSKFFTKK